MKRKYEPQINFFKIKVLETISDFEKLFVNQNIVSVVALIPAVFLLKYFYIESGATFLIFFSCFRNFT